MNDKTTEAMAFGILVKCHSKIREGATPDDIRTYLRSVFLPDMEDIIEDVIQNLRDLPVGKRFWKEVDHDSE